MTLRDISAKNILVIHGPNLNLLGIREPEIYGKTTLDDINRKLYEISLAAEARLEVFQSNSEGELINRVQQAMRDETDFIIINPAGLTHTSIALRDALAATGLPFIEIHLSNIYAREAFRQKSYFSDLAIGVISGLGAKGYELALQSVLSK
ncbi:type II 3-dehydroquinate dehydratase [Nitrosomonas communis]|uniref:type II 3-dehydroquinate dehydratase n=1 Tax=Nitrosomonas communis TaxID=44574 RepID=UPI0026EEB657|nr:type II 3-dehydroquinate dehydratase [Nitrosomonas communis]MCO6427611.1 type II 3-dehydroquinate dehydratase [Nitrosomonas communis]